MADNYQQFSEIIPALTEPERTWAERVLACNSDGDHADDGTDAKRVLKEAGIRVRTIDCDDWPGFQFELKGPDFDLWLYGHEYANVSHVGEFVRAFLARFRPIACWSLTWAESCSKPRLGEFGGGGLFVTARTVKVFNVAHWVDRRRRKFEKTRSI